jgi:S-adenosylmethionine:diacylglycerol 3-amino-3-carboxypropyl transferase
VSARQTGYPGGLVLPASEPPPVPGLLATRSWFTPAVAIGALRPGPDDRVFAAAGSGDVGFACAAAATVDLVDVRLAQAAYTRLSLVAARELPVQSVRSLLGYGHHGRRVWFYHFLRPHLDDAARTFWDSHEGAIRLGLATQGQIERRIAGLRARALRLAVGRDVIHSVLESPDVASQAEIFRTQWDGWRWRAALRVGLAPVALAGANLTTPRLVGADPAYPNRIADRVRHSFDTHPIRREPALRWALTGDHGGDDALDAAEACWLGAAGHAALREAAPRVSVHHARLADVLDRPPPGGWTRFHLGDALDELDPAAQTELIERILRAAAPGARMVSWRLVRPYARSASLARRVERDDDASAAAWAREVVPAWSGVDVERLNGGA